ncbi:MAG: amino acid dehydrogenase [Proteobacteria bacterium]|nr:amino acid dehydrogenase [Pseudomonadota bacterium]
MNRYTQLDIPGYEEVVRCDNPEVGFTAWIAIHNTHRGPALGGCRVWRYESEDAALIDVLRLGKGMTYKNALARLPLGGGKSVVHCDLKTVNRTALFTEIGNFVETLEGRYITAEDVNSTLADMVVVQRRTRHVATVGASGNPSPFTAYGVYCAIKTSVKHKLKRERLDGLTVAIQGIGETGGRLAEMLKKDNCRIIAADINTEHAHSLREKIDFHLVAPDDIYGVACDIFAPCALGSTLNSRTIPQLLCQIVAGSANNQLQNNEDGAKLFRRGILYAPDYVANAGGVINISCEIDQTYDPKKATQLTAAIEQTLMEIYRQSAQQKLPTNVVADSLAEERFGATLTC